jgi:hypothetical protein
MTNVAAQQFPGGGSTVPVAAIGISLYKKQKEELLAHEIGFQSRILCLWEL